MSNVARFNRLLRASEQEYKDDPFGKALANLERADLACSEATADFLKASRELREAIGGLS